MTSTSWLAAMITPEQDFDGAPLLRREFTLDDGHGAVAKATLRATALGVYEASINGVPVGPDVLSPGWSSYEWRLRYRSYDVTAVITPTSVIGVELGNGWYRGRLAWHGLSNLYGSELGFFGQLDIEFADGHVQTVASDTTWQAGPSATTVNDLYDGQTIDARRLQAGWAEPGFARDGAQGADWTGVRELAFDAGRLAEPVGPPVVRTGVVRPVEVFTSPGGKTLVDFGQNLVGWLRFTVQGEAGRTITVRHAEVLEDGELGARPLRSAKATDTFILSGGRDSFEPTKTFHGFRYAEVTGWPGTLTADDLEAVVVHSYLERIGTFECSNDLVNQLHRNIVWGLRGNFLDLPTDCPQRDERLGWTGDIAVFAPTAAYLYDVKGFLQDWLLDLATEQKAQDGLVPITVPDVLKYCPQPAEFPAPESSALWSEASVWVPWALWEAYGDLGVLQKQYESMAAHTRRVEGLLSANGLWDSGFQFGDWLDPDAAPDQPWAAKADTAVVATACMYRTARLTAQAAGLLGKHDDEAHFNALAARVRNAFAEHYVAASGTIRSDCTTVYALAIAFDVLLTPELREFAGNRLAELVRDNGYRVSTGFAGTPFITHALTDTGHVNEAYRLLLEEGCPSWLYPVTMGATTVWERWDSMLPDGTINPGEMTSFNHYALGAVADWMHKAIGGIRPLEPGYSRVLIQPQPGEGISWARTSLKTPHGEVRAAWTLDGGEFRLEATVPDGVAADVVLPDGSRHGVTGGTHRFEARVGVLVN
ncbi:alpha-L-rhamnosidase [Pseudarthrobacter chlorophenolicus A6]|uniref:alpha-L-rhamnosidase n=1 Tax=Pseudarthrobacter chlorophenolicus (strain ATCC 700700 / DSM 12829 / CIP 107037 / JCM 12360 / KCTC 9906 / NCIMB 13794 / A6) TaxID=452863 RepID=B8HAG4_PSECP|nr:family 78 glycoside hydrolase catalytic domain [Pseudarthrobacter chlorophenolicus]ACL38425.1 alpha-L-rhamnosidase [Pseudarthrobacter chlorophenolicus A6]SDQ49089.1 alpha-L-rhamnosidase [Pseudarthrobacter chlorophenolicus]